jgi:DNA mismatch repair protein MutS2
MTAPFSIGAQVHVASLGKGTVREIRGSRYLVEIKGRSLIVTESQLTRLDAQVAGRGPQGAGRGTNRDVSQAPDPAVPSRPHAPSTIDLHGMTTDETEAALVAFVSDAILAGHAELRVIHGRSGGRLKATVHARLRSMSAVRSFRLDPQNPGVTLVAL